MNTSEYNSDKIVLACCEMRYRHLKITFGGTEV